MLTPLIVVLLVFAPLLISRTLSRPLDAESALSIGLALAFAFFAMGHFVQTDEMVEMLPAWLPERRSLIYVTGAAEALTALGLLTTRFRHWAALAAGVMLVAFFPANIYAAMNSVSMGGHKWGPAYLLIRIPLQAMLIGVVLFVLGRLPLYRR
jgi:uncharacterized membrane protein